MKEKRASKKIGSDSHLHFRHLILKTSGIRNDNIKVLIYTLFHER